MFFVMQVVNFMLMDSTAREMFNSITDNITHEPAYYRREPVTSRLAEDHGTSHLSVLAENGDAVAVTTTINTLYVSTL